ncbi:hypothetical protein GCM10023085_27770 [Actinomadura viridis]
MGVGKGVMAKAPRSLAAVLAVLAAGVLAAGCGGGGSPEKAKETKAAGPPPVPSGFIQARAGRVAFAHPAGWKPVEQTPQGWSYAVEEDGEDGGTRAGVITKVPQVPMARLVADTVTIGVEVNAVGVRRGAGRKVSVPGAGDAVRVDYTYSLEEGAAADRRATDVSVVYGTESAVVVRIAGEQARLAPDQVEQIVRSIAIVP